MIAALLLTLAAPQDFELKAETIPWESLPKHFDLSWELPSGREGRDLAAEMRRLAELKFGELEGAEELRCFGDLVREVRRLDREALEARLKRLESRHAQLAGEWGPQLRELLHDDYLFSKKWRPAKDHERDGMLTGSSWEPTGLSAPWDGVKVTVRFEQAAALLDADLATIKRVENDYRTYHGHVGPKYKEIYPLAGQHVRGVAPDGAPFHFIQIRFRCKLPIPFGSYKCDLDILDRVAADGMLRTDIHSGSPDFHYLAGRDLYFPVVDSTDTTVAYLLVRDFGFDLDGVPDGAGDRREALRGSIGNLKRKAERAPRDASRVHAKPREVLPQIRVRGKR